ncbi:MAG: protein kinase [Acidobacteriota bacterium]
MSPIHESDPLIGRTLKEYVIREKLGEGGFGIVYRAEQSILSREAVIKVLHQKHWENRQIIDRFMREAKLASRLEHPYTAHIYDFGAEADGLMWIAMEYVRGTPLDKLLKAQGPLPLERFVPLLDKLCQVIHTAHESGIIHRDIKPANVMVVSRAGRLLPKLLDFGIAKGLGANATSVLAPAPAFNLPGLASGDTMEVAAKEIPSDTAGMLNSVSPLANISENQATQVLGSPAYMAPEQWDSNTIVDARMDIYAIGALTYEALTGRPPFQETGYALMYAHMIKEVPSLGPSFPPVLDSVIAKVMAKRSEDRYQTALEFANAFREAAGFSEKHVSLPQLEESLLDNILFSAPQPLAEAAANLRMARNARQARDSMLEIFRIIVRFLGLFALAAHAQTATDDKSNSQAATAILLQLRKKGLSEEEWLEATRKLSLPFVSRPDAHPIPEMVLLLCNKKEADRETDDLFEPLLEMQRRSLQGAASSEEQILAMLHQYLPKLNTLLTATRFLCEYQLIVPRESCMEKWMGLRKSRYDNVTSRSETIAAGHPWLADSEGHPVLSLWPFFQVAEPSPGVPELLFFLDGKGRQGAKLVAMPFGFEHHDAALWEWLRSNFFTAEDKAATAIQQEKTPYLGLAAFTASDADMFFGREREVESFLNRLRTYPLLAVVGASGAGKSSFVQAGVIPALPENWRAIIVRPGATPLASLSAQFAKEKIKLPELTLSVSPDTVALALREAAETSGKTFLLVIDQFEELFTLCLNNLERQLYAQMLARAARSAQDPVRLILTLRDDFLMRVKQLSGLSDKVGLGLELLATPAPRDLLRILTEPANRVGYEFEDPQLPQEIIDAVADKPGALPLMAFTAAKLWELRDRQFKQLKRKSYEGMGGIGGALAQHAEEMMSQLTQAEQRLVREAFRHLISSEGTRAILTRTELLQVLGQSREAERVVEKLIGARLLAASEGENGVERVEVVHEALLSAWPRLVKWRREDSEGARMRDQLRSAVRQWEERNRPQGLLWRDEALAEYQLWRSRYTGKLTESEEAFGQLSVLQAQQSERKRKYLVRGALAVLMAGLIVLVFMYDRTQKALALVQVNAQQAQLNAQQAKSQLLELYVEQGRQEFLAGNPLRAAVYLNEAYKEGQYGASLRFLLTQTLKLTDAQLASLDGHLDEVVSANFSSDGKLLVTASTDKTAKLWDAENAKFLFSFEGHAAAVNSAVFSPDGKRVVTASKDNTAKVWDVAQGVLLFSLEGHAGEVNYATFSLDGSYIITASSDRSVKVWIARDGTPVTTLNGHDGAVNYAKFNPDNKRVVTASKDNTARLWDITNGQLLHSLQGHTGEVNMALFSPDGQRVVTASKDNAAKVWDCDSGKLLYSLDGHNNWVLSVSYSPNGKNIVTASQDSTAKIWDASDGKLLVSLDGHTNLLNTALFSSDGERIVTASQDKTAKVWDAVDGKLLASLNGHDYPVNFAIFSPNGDRVVTGSYDATAKLWDVHLETRSAKEIAEIVTRRAPWRFDHGRLIPVKSGAGR